MSIANYEGSILTCEIPLMQLLVALSLPLVLDVIEDDETLWFADCQHLLQGSQGVGRVIDAILSCTMSYELRPNCSTSLSASA
jgi:hypothetical protein